MSLLAACQSYVESKDRDGDIILVALSEHLDSGQGDDAVQLLLQDEYVVVLDELGWDILSVVCPRLSAREDNVMWSLVQRIVERGSPKEMCLAILEQMETLSAANKTAIVFNMLQYLQKALLSVSQETIVTSTLHSVYRLVQLHCPQLEVRERDNVAMEKDHSIDEKAVNEVSDEGMVSQQCEGQVGHMDGTCVSCDQDKEVESCVGAEGGEEGNFFIICNKVLAFIRPFVDRIQHKAIQPELLFKARHIDAVKFQEQKIECIAILLCLLDYPLVNCSLKLKRKEGLSTPTRAWSVASSIMSLIVRCHYGCVQLLSCQHHPSEQSGTWSRVGLASFAHLLFVEELELDYIPAVLDPRFLLSLSLCHIQTLLER